MTNLLPHMSKRKPKTKPTSLLVNIDSNLTAYAIYGLVQSAAYLILPMMLAYLDWLTLSPVLLNNLTLGS